MFCIINYFELIPLSKYLNVSLIGLRLYIAKSALIIFPFLIFSYIKFEIIQSIQSDSKKVWKNLNNKISFNNLSDLISLVEKLLNNRKYCSALLQEISENFRYSEKSIEKSLDKIFNILS